MFNCETRLHDCDSGMFDGQWFEDEDGFLYIVPVPGVIAEYEGPDNETMDGINEACQDHGKVTDSDADRLGLTAVQDALKRFSAEDGYYHA